MRGLTRPRPDSRHVIRGTRHSPLKSVTGSLWLAILQTRFKSLWLFSISRIINGPHASAWCHTDTWSCPQRRGYYWMVIIILSSQWPVSGADLVRSEISASSQLATYLLNCIHKLNRGNSSHNHPHNLSLWPASVIESLLMTDDFNHHCIIEDGAGGWALHHRDPITASQPRYQCHVPQAARATDICTCPTCPPAAAHNWMWWRSHETKLPRNYGAIPTTFVLSHPNKGDEEKLLWTNC